MIKYVKYILIFVLGINIIGCISKKFTFDNKEVSIKSKIIEDHQIIDNRLGKLDGMYCLYSSEEIKEMKNNFTINFKDEKLSMYNFIITLSNESLFNYNFHNYETVYYKDQNILKISYLGNEHLIHYLHQKKIKKGYINFGCTSNLDIDLNFLKQKFDEIEIIEK